MTDEKKAPWTRCPKCRQRLFNDKLDIEYHRDLCPADFKRAITNLARQVEDLKAALADADARKQTVVPVPTLDLDSVAPWPDDEGPEDEEQEVPDIAPIFEEVVTAAAVPLAPAIDEYDDEDEDDGIPTIGRPVMR